MFLKGCLLKRIYLIYFIFHFFPCQNKLLFKENLINTHIYFDYKWPCHTFPGMRYIYLFSWPYRSKKKNYRFTNLLLHIFFFSSIFAGHHFINLSIRQLKGFRLPDKKKDCWTPIFHLLFFIHEITDKYLRNKKYQS